MEKGEARTQEKTGESHHPKKFTKYERSRVAKVKSFLETSKRGDEPRPARAQAVGDHPLGEVSKDRKRGEGGIRNPWDNWALVFKEG